MKKPSLLTLPILSILAVITAAGFWIGQNSPPRPNQKDANVELLSTRRENGLDEAVPVLEAKAEARRLDGSGVAQSVNLAKWPPATNSFNRAIPLSLEVARRSVKREESGAENPEAHDQRTVEAPISATSAASASIKSAAEPFGAAASAQSKSVGAVAAAGAPQSTAPLPVVFRDPPPEVAANPQAAETLQQLRQTFVDAVGGANQDPADPAYLERWLAAQRTVDEQYRLRFGNQAFLAAQLAANSNKP